jgi:hypothetical protein
MSNLKKLRDLNAKAKEARAAAPEAPDPALPVLPVPAKGKPVASRVPPSGGSVKFRCGHAKPQEWFAKRQCPECVTEAAKAEKAKQDKARAERFRAKQEATARGEGHRHGHLADRLPEGSTFHVQYDAKETLWSGTLVVAHPDEGQEPLHFEGTSSAVFQLLPKLDQQWREWKWKRDNAPQGEVPPSGEPRAAVLPGSRGAIT